MDADAVPWISATAITMFAECPRKWGFRYLQRLKGPQTKGAALGTEVQDTQIDPYLASGRPFDFSRRTSAEIAEAVRPLMPAPMAAGMKIRRKFQIPSPTGQFLYVGELDVWAPDSSIVPGLPGGAALAGDLKTTSNLEYAKSAEDLKTDVQAQLYAMDLMYEDRVDAVDLVWWYVRTRGKARSQRVHLRVHAPQVAEQFCKIDERATVIARTKIESPDVNELEPNPKMCDAYGGCPYRHLCNLSPATHAAAVNREAQQMNADFVNQLRKSQAPQGAPAPCPAPPGFVWNGSGFVPAPAAEPPQPASSLVPVAPGTPGSFPVHAAGSATGLTPGQTYAPPAPQIVDTPAAAAAAGLPAFLQKPVERPSMPAINPPESALPPAPPVGAAAPAPEPKKVGRPKASASKDDSKTINEALAGNPAITELPGLVTTMRALGVKELNLGPGGSLYGVTLFEVKS